MIPTKNQRQVQAKGVPRMRGDDPRCPLGHDGHCVFPACAGMIPVLRRSKAFPVCVPRMRGDDPADEIGKVDIHECSPHARG